MRQPSPSSTARVRSEARSEPASGSLKPWHQMTSPAAMAERCCCLLGVRAEGHDRRPDPVEAHVLRAPRLVVGPHLLAHHGLVPHRAAAAAVLGGPGEGEETLLGEGPAEALGDVEVGGIAGERAEVVLRDVRRDQLPQPDPQGGGRLAEVEVHGALHSAAKSDTNVSRVASQRCSPSRRRSARVLDRALAADPDREALVTRTRRLTYAELDAEAEPGRPRAAGARRPAG